MVKNSTKKLLALMDRCAKAVGFRHWGAMIDAARRNEDLVAVLATLDADRPNLFKAFAQGLRLRAGVPAPSATQEQIERTKAIVSRIPTETIAIAEALDRLSQQDRQELLKDASDFIAEKREALRTGAQRVPTGLPGRKPIPEGTRQEIVNEVEKLCNQKHFRKSDAVAQVSHDRKLSQRTIWNILRQRRAGKSSTDQVRPGEQSSDKLR